MDCFSAFPEAVVSEIFSRTSPTDACRLTAVSRGFKSVADSDDVWERFLPSDHRELVSRSVYPMVFSTKKQLYFLMADSFNLLDSGKLSFSLNKASGKKCFMLGARELAIESGRYPINWTWRHYWPQSRIQRHIPLAKQTTENSLQPERAGACPDLLELRCRFPEVANLKEVPCFYITGKIESRLLSPETTYAAYIVFNLGPRNCGCNFLPAEASVRFDGEQGNGDTDGDGDGDGDGDENNVNNIVSLATRSFHSVGFFQPFSCDEQFAQQRMDKWMETKLGEFFNARGDTGEVEMRLMGLETDFWTYDLFVEGIQLRPMAQY